MKHLIYSLLLLTLITSCKRDVINTTSLASLKIINAVTGGTQVKLRGVYSTIINNNSNRNFAVFPGYQDLYIYPEADSLHPYYHGNNKVVMETQQCYSLFLGGTPTDVTSMLIHDNWEMKQDSSIRVRFVNLSPGSPAISVNLTTSTNVNEFSNIAFGQISDFKPYSKVSNNTEYTFEFRNAITNELITTYTNYDYLFAYNHFKLV
ncbi:MAG: DUF4397 domain-containing protein, partial [Chitinophagaceae bacterium]|nr:DUF4397 domain-containing protein [Chitinophagaceae bacterium]